MFNTMMEGIKEESVAYLFNSQVEVQQNPIVEESAGEVPATPGALGQIAGAGLQDAVVQDAVVQDAVVEDAVVEDAGSGAQDGATPGGRRARGRRGGGRHSAGGAGGGRHSAGAAGGRTPAAPPAAGAPSVVAPGLGQPQRPGKLSYSAPTVDGEARVERRTDSASSGDFGKVGRNAPCPCGSGRKYKLCHGDPRNRPAD